MGQGAGEGGGSSPPRPEAVGRGQRGPAPPLTQGAAWAPGSGLLGDILVDPVQVGGDAGVDAGPVGLRAAVAPADHTCLQPGAVHLADQGTSRVTLQGGVGGSVWLQSQAVGAAGSLTHLAGVPPAVPSTQVILLHDGYAVVRGQARVVLPVTDTVLHDGHLHLLQGVWGRQGPWGEGAEGGSIRGKHAVGTLVPRGNTRAWSLAPPHPGVPDTHFHCPRRPSPSPSTATLGGRSPMQGAG